MADRPSHIEDKTAWEIHTREARHARLQSLADSVNDTARMARNSLSLLLIVALYISWLLTSSTDENLLRNSQVVLPQVGVGISVAQNYIFAPPIFLYLHVQLLFLLTVLARKVRTFEVALKEEFPNAATPNRQKRVEAEREECWDWLSAFAFVQLFRLRSSIPHVSKVLAWTGIEAVPLVLLFILDLSFVRYQSNEITWSHHIIFVADLAFLKWFNWRVFRGRFRTLWTYLIRYPQTLREIGATILRRSENSAHGCSLRAERQSWEMLGRFVAAVWGVVVFGMALLLLCAAHLPSFDPKTSEKDRWKLWGEDKGFWKAVWDGGNPLDAGPCERWRLACRYLDVSNERPVEVQAQDVSGPKSDKASDKSFANIDLAGRKLRFENFQYAQLQGADLRDAQLQGAFLVGARLQGANLVIVQLQSADLWEVQLQGARLVGAQLQGADLLNARLQGADLTGARLQGANLADARLQGATLWGAQLQCADLREVRLQGADLWNAQLQGTDLGNKEQQSSNDKSHPWYLVWAPGVSYNFPADKLSYLETLVTNETATVKLAWNTEMSLGEHLQKCIEENWEHRDPLLSSHNNPDWNAWAKWTAGFACENEYTARSSLTRWSRRVPLSDLKDPAEAKKRVRGALAAARKTKTGEECPGLHSIPDDEWKKFIEGRRP